MLSSASVAYSAIHDCANIIQQAFANYAHTHTHTHTNTHTHTQTHTQMFVIVSVCHNTCIHLFHMCTQHTIYASRVSYSLKHLQQLLDPSSVLELKDILDTVRVGPVAEEHLLKAFKLLLQ